MAAVFAVLLFLAPTVAPSAVAENSDSEPNYFLLDYGNGATEWLGFSIDGTYRDILSSVLSDAGHDVSFDPEISIDGKSSSVIGGSDTGGTLTSAGATGVTVRSSWHMFVWDTESGKWNEITDADSDCTGMHIAVGFYPDGTVPVETPTFRSSWTSVGGDSELSFNQSAILNSSEGSEVWHISDSEDKKYSGVYGSILYAQGYSFVTYGNRSVDKPYSLTVCYDSDWNTVWEFRNDSQMLDTSSSAIYGDRIYISSSMGYVYTFNWKEGPGSLMEPTADLKYVYDNVTTFGGLPMGSADSVPVDIEKLDGSPYGQGFGSIVYDSGCIFVKHRNGMTYCFDSDLNLVWSFLSGGYNYYTAPTVSGGYVFSGSYDGKLYALNETDGTLVSSVVVYREDTKFVGRVAGICAVPTDNGTALFMYYDDGKGMGSSSNGYAVFRFDGESLALIRDFRGEFGSSTTYGTKVVTDGFAGVYISAAKGIYAVGVDGEAELISTSLREQNSPHAPFVFVNGKYLFVTTYSALIHKIFVLNLDGEILKEVVTPVESYNMCEVTVVDGFVIGGNDAGAYCFTAIVDDYNPPSPPGKPLGRVETALCWVGGILAVFAVAYAVLRFGLGWAHPLAHIRNSIHVFLYGESYTHSVRKKHRLWLILSGGFAATFCVAAASLCIGSDSVMGLPEALSAGWSAICKGGHSLTYEEMLIYNSRLPRTLAALAAGIGLSVAGAVYQAIIRNPLVEPYIMGVSAGAGTLAVSVLVFGFTFFGLFPAESPFLTVMAAMVGGLLAFGLTMFLAHMTGGKSINYVLSGIVIGLVFSAVQSVMMVSAGNSVASALSWLYGSFASMDWTKLWLMLIPALALSVVPMIWAKEFNLVLLGEDQARLMGLDVRKFNSAMLILASVLTAFCVAFCGIIGFVGLVVPHLCRMILGGDHRLVFPSVIAFGGVLMIAADLLARALVPGYELPVGAITTVIGVPMFAYLLIKRGRNYD